MRRFFLNFLLAISMAGEAIYANPASNLFDIAKTRCSGVPDESEPFVRNSDFAWNLTQEQMLSLSKDLYMSGKRLKGRAYFDPMTEKVVVSASEFSPEKKISLTQQFIKSVTRHIEEALRLDYAQAIMFSDMGHSHFLIPEEFYKRELEPIPPSHQDRLLEKALAHPDLKILYHTAEQLKMMDENKQLLLDPFLQWRYYTRNLVGDNLGQGRLEIHKHLHEGFNTVREASGYRYYGGGFYINASSKGCFPYQYQGETFYFDLSFQSLPYESAY